MALTALLFLLLTKSSLAFQQPRSQHKAATNFVSSTKNIDEKTMGGEQPILRPLNNDHILPSPDPFQHEQQAVADIDLSKAQEFASHFGKYSYDEIEQMRNDLHTHRAESMAHGDTGDILFLERFLEDDLNSQLNSLIEDMPIPDPYPFRDQNDVAPIVSKVEDKDKVVAQQVENSDDLTPKAAAVESKNKFGLHPELFEEGVLESLAICVLLGLLVMAPRHVF